MNGDTPRLTAFMLNNLFLQVVFILNVKKLTFSENGYVYYIMVKYHERVYINEGKQV